MVNDMIYPDCDDLAGLPDNAAVLIRIDPALGFTKDNVAIVSAAGARLLIGKSVEERRLAVTPPKGVS